jgi:hypothetical protein
MVGIYVAQKADLTAFGGSADGWIFECIFQEIDIETGDLIFEWKSTDHVALNETYNDLGSAGTEDAPFDYFHINSIEKDGDGNYLVSGRVMDCVYKINGTDGTIIWRLHGKQSDFDVEDAANFAFQHDARWIDDKAQTRMTIFDNGPTDAVGYSRGMLLAVDQSAMTVRLVTEFKNGAQTFAMFEGSLQAINASDTNTNYFLGYGNQPFFTELDSDGNILLDVQFGKTNAVNSYRAYKLPWQGKPLSNPDIHYDLDGKKAYFSWNGATDVETWNVYTANETDATTWTEVINATRTGFETEIDLSSHTDDLLTYVRGKAVSTDGQTLGWTQAGNGNALFDAPVDVDVTPSSTGGGGGGDSAASSTSSGSVSSTSSGSAPTTTKKSAAVRSGADLPLGALVVFVVALLVSF